MKLLTRMAREGKESLDQHNPVTDDESDFFFLNLSVADGESGWEGAVGQWLWA